MKQVTSVSGGRGLRKVRQGWAVDMHFQLEGFLDLKTLLVLHISFHRINVYIKKVATYFKLKIAKLKDCKQC